MLLMLKENEREALASATEALPPATESLPPATEALPPATEALPPATEALPPATEDSSASFSSSTTVVCASADPLSSVPLCSRAHGVFNGVAGLGLLPI